MVNSIQIIEKPDWISWDDIHNVLWAAHSENRARGIIMRYASLTGDEIRQRVEGKGKFYCAVKDGRVIGTAAIVKKTAKLWFDKSPSAYAYHCFASVLSEYAGQGIYKGLYKTIEKESKEMGLPMLMFDTHENNRRIIEINQKNGFKPVDFKYYKDHFNVVMVRWLNGCPYSELRIRSQFAKRKLVSKTKQLLKSLLHK